MVLLWLLLLLLLLEKSDRAHFDAPAGLFTDQRLHVIGSSDFMAENCSVL
jgi:hypothetical protein